MTSLTGYIQGLGNGEKRTVDKRGKEIKLSVFDNIDRVIVFNEAGETSQETNDGRNLFVTGITSGSAGVTYTVNSDGSISLSGTSTATSFFTAFENVPINSGTYTLSQTGHSPIHLYIRKNTASGDNLMDASTSSSTATLEAQNIAGIIRINSGVNCDGITLYPQLEAGSSATPYQPYCGGIPSPNPSYPQAVEGIGFKQQDGTYTVRIDYDDGDEHFGSITASGLAYPLYEGDVLDFVNGKVIRANGCVDLGSLTWVSENSTVTGLARAQGTGIKWQSIIFCEYFIYSSVTSYSQVNNGEIALTNSESTPILRIRWEDWGSYSDAQIKTALDGVIAVYKLSTPTDEYITLTGDISDIGTATVLSDGTLTVKYDKVEMAIRKYSSPPDWSKIGYSATPNAIIDAFNYSKQIYDTWSFVMFTSDLNLRIFPNVDISGQLGLNGMFKGCTNLISLPPLEIGTDSGTLNASEFARNSGIEEVDITSNNLSQENNFQNGFNGCSFLKSYSITAKVSNVNAMFSGCSSLAEAPDFDTSTTSNFSEMFSGCSSLTYVSDDFDTSSGTNFYRCFYNCSSLENIPSWNLRNGTNLQQLFAGCSSIKNVPPLVITAATNLTNMFQNSGSNLTELSRNNILMMLATASAYTGTKTLAAVGFTSSMYTASSWQALTNYNDFVTAGWSIGYN